MGYKSTDAVPVPAPDRLLKDREFCAIIGVSRSGFWAGVKTGKFPQPIRLGEKTTRWRMSDALEIVANGLGGASHA